MKTHWEGGGAAPRTLYFDIRWNRTVSFKHRLLHASERPWYSLR